MSFYVQYTFSIENGRKMAFIGHCHVCRLCEYDNGANFNSDFSQIQISYYGTGDMKINQLDQFGSTSALFLWRF